MALGKTIDGNGAVRGKCLNGLAVDVYDIRYPARSKRVLHSSREIHPARRRAVNNGSARIELLKNIFCYRRFARTRAARENIDRRLGSRARLRPCAARA